MSRDFNVLQFINSLNTIEPAEGSYSSASSATSPNSNKKNSKTGDDLSVFATTEFFDFDAGRNTDLSVVDDMLMQQEKSIQAKQYEQQQQQQQEHQQASTSSHIAAHDFGGSFPLTNFSIAHDLPQAPVAQPHTTNSTSTTYGYQHHQPQFMQAPPVAPMYQQAPPPAPAPTPAVGTPAASGAAPASKKRKTSASPSNSAELSEEPRVAAEEDKRRRNTAASARFRIKKKLREQEMERNARELQEKVQQLETKVMQLEMENRWLKNLVVEKNEARDASTLLDMKNKVLADAQSSLVKKELGSNTN